MIRTSNIKSFIAKSTRFGLFIPISSIMTTHFSSCVNKEILKKISKLRNTRIDNCLSSILDIERISKINVHTISEISKIQQPIWYCWLQGKENLPLIPRLCLDSLYKHAGSHPVKIVTLKNFHDYTEIPLHILDLYYSGHITHALFSDILRVSLIHQQGGLWMDSTMLVTQTLPPNIFELPLFSIRTKEFGNFVSRCRWTGFCLAGQKYNILGKLLCESFNEYFKKEKYSIDYFLIDYLINIIYEHNEIVRKMIDNIPFNNENVHSLTKLLPNPYNEDVFSSLTQNTCLFKLSWKAFREDDLKSNSNNFYNYLRKKIN